MAEASTRPSSKSKSKFTIQREGGTPPKIITQQSYAMHEYWPKSNAADSTLLDIAPHLVSLLLVVVIEPEQENSLPHTVHIAAQGVGVHHRHV